MTHSRPQFHLLPNIYQQEQRQQLTTSLLTQPQLSALDVKYEYNYRNASDRLVGPWAQASVTFDVGATIAQISRNANHNSGTIEVRLVADNNYDLGSPSLLATPPAATDALPQLTISASWSR